jgi:hypothetical protein
MFRSTANATVCIENGRSRGSGFHFLRPEIIVTNRHVIVDPAVAIMAVTEDGVRLELELIDESSPTEHDFAILRSRSAPAAGRSVLRPKTVRPFERGMDVLFAGFPHGIPHLLVQRAVVCGLVSDHVFYLDGSVNGGNSGGPIVDSSDGKVVGVVTQRRFLGAEDLAQLSAQAEKVRGHCQAIAGRGRVEIMGINFGAFSQLMAEGMLLVREALAANANTGIGIGFSIAFAEAACQRLGVAAGH